MFKLAICDETLEEAEQLAAAIRLCLAGHGNGLTVDCYAGYADLKKAVKKEPARYRLVIMETEAGAEDGNVCLDLGNDRLPLDCTTRPLFSYVPQGNMLFSGSLRDNVTFISTDASQQEIDRALELSLAKEFIDQLPEGLDTVVGENGVGLSEGQIQRIAIARAVLTRSPILLLDEATSALDEQTERKVLDNLKTIEGITLIIVTHKKAALSICNKNIQIKQKRIEEKIIKI